MLFLHRLENFYGCPYDFVEVFDGPQSESFSLGRFCSGTTPTFTSSSNRLTVVFHSDAIVTNMGFHASYESIVQDEINTGKSFGHFPCLVAGEGGWPTWTGHQGWPGDSRSLIYPRGLTGRSS